MFIHRHAPFIKSIISILLFIVNKCYNINYNHCLNHYERGFILVAKNKRRKLPYHHKTGTHMITKRSRKSNKIEQLNMHCSNCSNYVKGACKVLTEQNGGKTWYLSDKSLAKRCKYFKNKHKTGVRPKN